MVDANPPTLPLDYLNFKNQEQYLIFVSNNFKIPSTKVTKHILQVWCSKLQKQSVILIHSLDKAFFNPLWKRLSLRKISAQRVDSQSQQLFKNFIEIIEGKLQIIDEIVKQVIYKVIPSSKKQKFSFIESFIYNRIIQYLFPSALKLIEYLKKAISADPNMKVSKAKAEKNRPKIEDQLKFNIIRSIFESQKAKQTNADFRKSEPERLNFIHKEFIEKVAQQLKATLQQRLSQQQIETPFKKQKGFLLQNLQHEQVVNVRCINCNQFLYQNLELQSERSSVVDFQVIQSVRDIKRQPLKIYQSLAAFLNSGGGTLFFNCKKTKFGFVPEGYKMSMREQEGYKTSIYNLLKSIQPQSYFKFIDSDVDFIPIKLTPDPNPSNLMVQTNKLSIQRFFLPQLYVMRVKIRSKNKMKFFGCEIDKKIYFYNRSMSRTLSLQGQQSYEQMKKNYLYHLSLDNQHILNKISASFGNYEKEPDELLFSFLRGRKHLLKSMHDGLCRQPYVIFSNLPTK